MEANGNPIVQQRLARFRNSLLAEHLDVPFDRVRDKIDEQGSIIGAIEGLRGSGRSLEIFDGQIPAEVDEWVPDAEFVDPPRPYETQLVPREHRPSTLRQIILGTSLLLAVLALAAAWRWSPLGTWIEIPRLLGYIDAFDRSPAAPLITIAGFLIGGLLVAPVTVLITVTVLAFGSMQGFLYSFAGMTLSAILTFYLGTVFGQRLVDRISPRLHRLSVRLAEKGVLAVVVVRVVPVAPFTIVNMVAGATRIRLKDFVVGTIIGELPGLIALWIFVDQITTTIKSPGSSELCSAGSDRGGNRGHRMDSPAMAGKTDSRARIRSGVSMRLVLATYNVHRCIRTDGRYDPRRIVAVFRELDADVIALQEVELYQAHHGLEVLEGIAKELNLISIAGPTLLERKCHYGNAVLTKCTPTSVRLVDLSQHGREPRGAIDLDISVSGGTCRSWPHILGLKPSERRIQVEKLLKHFGTKHCILMGVFERMVPLGPAAEMDQGDFRSYPISADISFAAPCPRPG